MRSRKGVKKAHERFQVENFLDWLNTTYRTDYKIVGEPDPPEAIIQSSNKTSWVEIGAAFYNDEYARDLNSFAAENEVHVPFERDFLVEPDKVFAKRFVKVVKKKLEKSTYVPFRDKYGPGYLVIPIFYPLLDSSTIDAINQEWKITGNVDDRGCFRSVRYSWQSQRRWTLKRWTFPA